MSAGIQDIKKVDVNLKGSFGNLTLRNYGEAGTSIRVESMDEMLYNSNMGANGDMLINKSYKPQNKRVVLNVLRATPDYSRLQALVAAEEAGTTNVFSCMVKDNNTGETYYSPSCVLEKAPAFEVGPQPAPDVEYAILMPSVIHTPPTKTVI